jgi:Fur family peroxide stress response transcriptional regulator
MAAMNPDREAFTRRLHEAGIRCTPQRWEIYRELAMATDHPTAEDLHARLKPRLPSLSLDTVYRTLATLERHGLTRRVPGAKASARYDALAAPHHHMVCRTCGDIQDFAWEGCDVESLPEAVTDWGQPASASLLVEGTCGQCLDEVAKKARHG